MNKRIDTVTFPTKARFLLLSFIFWIVWGTCLGLITYYGQASLGWDVALFSTMLGNIIGWSFWGLVTPIINWLRIKVRITRSTAISSLAIHTVLAFSFGIVQRAYFGFFQSQIGHRFSSETYEQHIDFYMRPGNILQNGAVISIVYWLVLGAGYAYEHYRESHEKDIKGLQLEKDLVSAKLTSLQYQLQPHFLFNTLNTVTALVSDKQDKRAISVISKLSELLRFSLSSAKVHEVTLQAELTMLDKYLEIIAIRFQDKIQITKNIKEETLNALVPNLILQPLVENAIIHGVEKNSAGGQLTISAEVVNKALHLKVSDSGRSNLDSKTNSNTANPNTTTQGTQTGLANTKERLETLYGDNSQMILTNPDNAGMTVELVIPFTVQAKQ